VQYTTLTAQELKLLYEESSHIQYNLLSGLLETVVLKR
jgi:hypothetical protein